MKNVVKHPLLGEITLSQSARARRISVTVKPTGEVRLSYPPYVSTKRAAAFLDSKAEWIIAARERLSRKVRQRPVFTPQQIEQLRAAAKNALPAKVEHYARMFGFRYGRVTIRAARSKWGSCTADNNISLSLYLMTLPEHLADYVIIHELCHTVHHDHSPRFHALLDRCTGGREKALRRELRTYSTGIAEE